MVDRVTVGGLQVASVLHAFVRDEALPGSGVDEAAFWAASRRSSPTSRRATGSCWPAATSSSSSSTSGTQKNPGPVGDQAAYEQLLRDLGYLVDEPADFTIETSDVDDEVAVQAGPQLVVPVLNARFAANAANARWGSLYDALYGTDALPEDDGQERGSSYNPKRGAEVIAEGARLPRRALPARAGQPRRRRPATPSTTARSRVTLERRRPPGWPTRRSTSATAATRPTPRACCWSTTGCTSRSRSTAPTPIGKDDAAGVKDLLLEAAVSTIMDLEDSVAAVDADDKVAGYRNWLRLNAGHPDRRGRQGRVVRSPAGSSRTGIYDGPNGQLVLPGRSLLFVRQVGHLMTTDAVLAPTARRSPRASSTRS